MVTVVEETKTKTFLGARSQNQATTTDLGPVPQKSINANPRLKVNHAVYFSAPRWCLTLVIGKTLHKKKSILKNKNKQKKLSPKVENMKQKFMVILD